MNTQKIAEHSDLVQSLPWGTAEPLRNPATITHTPPVGAWVRVNKRIDARTPTGEVIGYAIEQGYLYTIVRLDGPYHRPEEDYEAWSQCALYLGEELGLAPKPRMGMAY